MSKLFLPRSPQVNVQPHILIIPCSHMICRFMERHYFAIYDNVSWNSGFAESRYHCFGVDKLSNSIKEIIKDLTISDCSQTISKRVTWDFSLNSATHPLKLGVYLFFISSLKQHKQHINHCWLRSVFFMDYNFHLYNTVLNMPSQTCQVVI